LRGPSPQRPPPPHTPAAVRSRSNSPNHQSLRRMSAGTPARGPGARPMGRKKRWRVAQSLRKRQQADGKRSEEQRPTQPSSATAGIAPPLLKESEKRSGSPARTPSPPPGEGRMLCSPFSQRAGALRSADYSRHVTFARGTSPTKSLPRPDPDKAAPAVILKPRAQPEGKGKGKTLRAANGRGAQKGGRKGRSHSTGRGRGGGLRQ